MATNHLLDLGHRTVHHIGGDPDWVDAGARERGWAMAPRPGCPPGRCVERRLDGAEGGYEAGLALAQDPDVTAVFAANDQTALGALRALPRHGRSVPDDVSVVGFDDTPEAAYLVPPLTTVRQDLGEVGRLGVETPALVGRRARPSERRGDRPRAHRPRQHRPTPFWRLILGSWPRNRGQYEGVLSG